MVPQFRVSNAARPPLRIGILLDSPKVSAFFARVIEDIQASNFARIELLVYRKKSAPSQAVQRKSRTANWIERLLDSTKRKRILYETYQRFDQKNRPTNDPLNQVDCSAQFAGIESMEVEPIGKKFIHRFPDEAVERIRAKDFDVILRVGFNILHGDILNSARYGVWSYHHGDNDYYRGGPALFWELYEGAPLSGVLLQVLTEELDGGLVLCKSLFATQQTLSVSKNRYVPYWGATDFVIRKLNELHRFGWEYVRTHGVPAAPYQGKRKIYRTPTNVEMLRWLGPQILKKAVARLFRKNMVQHWRIGVGVGRQQTLGSSPTADINGFRWIEAPRGHFWADPFAIEVNGKYWAYFEDYSYRTSEGRICCAEIASDGSLVAPAPCIEQAGHHYSYPCVFRCGNELFMVPESANSNSIDLYCCDEFPDRWKKQASLLEGRFVDTNIWQQNGLWWLMTTSAEPDSRAGSLLLFFAESLAGEWQFHPANPICTDIRRNRNAGQVFQLGERWIRPSQSGCPTYGYSFSLNEILEISPEKYEEHHLTTIEPWSGLCGVHTYNRCGAIELSDGATMTALNKLI
jgi:hypothetical protein